MYQDNLPSLYRAFSSVRTLLSNQYRPICLPAQSWLGCANVSIKDVLFYFQGVIILSRHITFFGGVKIVIIFMRQVKCYGIL